MAKKQPSAPTPLTARDVSYSMNGSFLEFCDCFTVCPCWVDRAPDDGECTGVFAWVIDKGAIDGVDVSKQRVVSVSTHAGHRDAAKQRVMLFVDGDASEKQVTALAGAFTGCYGGPLGELASILGELVGVERASIDVKWGPCGTQLTVGRRIIADGVSSVGSTGDVTHLSDARLSTVLGTPAEVGVSRRFRVALPGHAIDIDVRGRSSMRGKFAYRNDPADG